VDDDAIRDAADFAARSLKLFVEPSGAAGLAALLCDRFSARGRCIAIVLSGANGDFAPAAVNSATQ
jgi:threonine dehydratase